MSFGENLQTIRKKNQLSQEGLAEMLGVSRQAVSKWELGEGYPEVEKLMLLSKKLNISLDSLLGGENTTADPGEGKAPAGIRIVSPHEGVIIHASKVTRSQQFKGGKNSPKFALYASEGKDLSLHAPMVTERRPGSLTCVEEPGRFVMPSVDRFFCGGGAHVGSLEDRFSGSQSRSARR